MTTYYLNQVPFEQLMIRVVDERRQPRDLRHYDFHVQVVFAGPDGVVRDGGGEGTMYKSYEGLISYEFGAISPFTQVGDYKIQLKLTRTTHNELVQYDVTDIGTIEVKKGLI